MAILDPSGAQVMPDACPEIAMGSGLPLIFNLRPLSVLCIKYAERFPLGAQAIACRKSLSLSPVNAQYRCLGGCSAYDIAQRLFVNHEAQAVGRCVATTPAAVLLGAAAGGGQDEKQSDKG